MSLNFSKYHNINHGTNREVLHLEVFVSDKKALSSFIQTVRTNYNNTQNTNKPKPTQIKIPSGKKIYDIKDQSVVNVTSTPPTATLRDSSNTKLSTPTPLSNGTVVELDPDNVEEKITKLNKIGTDIVSTKDYWIWNDSVKTEKITQSTDNTQPQDIILAMKEAKTITIDNKKYLFTNEEQTQALLYSDCIEIHPITFDWAKIIDEKSNDDISIFENVKKYFLPEFIEDELKISPMYKKLFDLIDTC